MVPQYNIDAEAWSDTIWETYVKPETPTQETLRLLATESDYYILAETHTKFEASMCSLMHLHAFWDTYI
jgi:hypothetical protein